MATVTATTTRKLPTGQSVRVDSTKGKKMGIISTKAGNPSLWFPYAPTNIKYSGFGMQWTETQREGIRKPLLLASGLTLRKISFDLLLASPNANLTWDKWLKTCEEMSITGYRLKLKYGSNLESGYWRLTSYSVQSERRHHNTQGISEATVSLEFTESHDAGAATGPASGGIVGGLDNVSADRPLKKPKTPSKSPSPTPTKPSQPKATTPKPVVTPKAPSKPSAPIGGRFADSVPTPPKQTKPMRTHVARRGETCGGLAVLYYRNSTLWTRIAKENNIKNPQIIEVGRILRIP